MRSLVPALIRKGLIAEDKAGTDMIVWLLEAHWVDLNLHCFAVELSPVKAADSFACVLFILILDDSSAL